MNVIKSIRIKKETVNELMKIEVVDHIELWHNGGIVVHLDRKLTDGRLQATFGQYLVQWKNGLWQVYGSDAFNNLFKNPGTEAGRQWQDE